MNHTERQSGIPKCQTAHNYAKVVLGSRLKNSSRPGGEADSGEEICGVSIVAGRNPSEILEAAKHSLNGVAIAIEDGRETVFPFAIGFGRDVESHAALFNLTANGVRVVALVAVQDLAIGEVFEQLSGGRATGCLAAGDHEGDRATSSVGQGMDFCRMADGDLAPYGGFSLVTLTPPANFDISSRLCFVILIFICTLVNERWFHTLRTHYGYYANYCGLF